MGADVVAHAKASISPPAGYGKISGAGDMRSPGSPVDPGQNLKEGQRRHYVEMRMQGIEPALRQSMHRPPHCGQQRLDCPAPYTTTLPLP
ncbi:hypothetical protein D3C81_719590 [compost metagenome]